MLLDLVINPCLRIFEKVTKHAKTTSYLFRASCFCTELRLLTQTSRLPRSRTVSPNFVLHRKKLKNWSSFLAMIRNVKPLSNHLNKKDSVTRFSTLFYHKTPPGPHMNLQHGFAKNFLFAQIFTKNVCPRSRVLSWHSFSIVVAYHVGIVVDYADTVLT